MTVLIKISAMSSSKLQETYESKLHFILAMSLSKLQQTCERKLHFISACTSKASMPWGSRVSCRGTVIGV